MSRDSYSDRDWKFFPINLSGGVDLFTDASKLDPSVCSRVENVESQRGPMNRRAGAAKIARLASPAAQGASHTFGTDAKYATFTPPLIPAGGHAIVRHFVATRPAAGKTAWITGARPAGQTYHVYSITLSETGVITIQWTDVAGTSHSIACAAVAADAVVHLFAVYDAVAGTYTAYVNGTSSGTPLTGLASTLMPKQDAGVVWTSGVLKQTGQAVTADTHFDGADDGLTLFTLRGKAATAGLTELLRRNSARAWPSPFMDFVLAHYDMDEASGTVMYDRSDRKNHGTYTGGPSVTSPVALLSAPCNMIERIDVPSGRWNLAGSFGSLFYQAIGGLA